MTDCGVTPTTRSGPMQEPELDKTIGFALKSPSDGKWSEYLFENIWDDCGFFLVLGRQGDHRAGMYEGSPVGKRHAALERYDYGLVGLSDLNSTNGTSLERKGGDLVRLNRGDLIPLGDGDVIVLAGEERLEFRYIRAGER